MAGEAHASDRCRDHDASSRVDGRRASSRVLVLLRILGPRRVADEAGAPPARRPGRRRRRGVCAATRTTACSTPWRNATTCLASFRSTRRSTWRVCTSGRPATVSWVRDPVMQEMFRARTLFDLRPVHGRRSLWQQIDAAVAGARRSGLSPRRWPTIAWRACLRSPSFRMPSWTATASTSGDVSTRAQRPAAAGGRGPRLRDGGGKSHLAVRRSSVLPRRDALLPEHEKIFREAADTFRVVLWQQGTCRHQPGARPAPSFRRRCSAATTVTSSRRASDRFIRLLEFTAERDWLRQPVTEPAFLRRYRARFDDTWSR